MNAPIIAPTFTCGELHGYQDCEIGAHGGNGRTLSDPVRRCYPALTRDAQKNGRHGDMAAVLLCATWL
jgi:hypothetical protein